MFVTRMLSRIRPQRQCLNLLRSTNHRMKSNKSDSDSSKMNPNPSSLGDMGTKYQIYRDEDSEVILDIYEERPKDADILDILNEDENVNPLAGINLERGVHGVYDIEDLVDVLLRENAEDIFVASVPKEIKYVDYICVTTGKSNKHMLGIAQFVKKVYKKKMSRTSDIFPKIEGENSKDWMALDLGNIALHIFSRNARQLYDLDSLWALGPQYDRECNKQDPVSEMLEKHSLYLKDLRPAQ